MTAMAGWFTFASWMFLKAYYPYGEILRASLNRSWFREYVVLRGPMLVTVVGAWYLFRESPQNNMVDMTCDSEE